MPEIVSRNTVFSTPWFEVVEKHTTGVVPGDGVAAFYAVHPLDYVTILAVTPSDQVVLVRQYRPVPEVYTVELPAGHVELGQTPEEAARVELREETGFVADTFELLGTLIPDSGRLANKLWCYIARGAVAVGPQWSPDEPIDVLLVDRRELLRMIQQGKFNHALHIASIALALLLPNDEFGSSLSRS